MSTATERTGHLPHSSLDPTCDAPVKSRVTPLTAVAAAAILGVIAFVGGWQRRWISDDGLIVLRTVRNLLAGNGPVFNAGERVEANTSTLWQYLITGVAMLTDVRLETIALWLALLLTTSALVIAALAGGFFHGRRRDLVLVPFGGLLYLALPPARDFATSGLEWGLSLFWLATWWLLLTLWMKQGHTTDVGGAGTGYATYLLAFWCGMSWLVRPELALYGGLTGIVLLITARNVKTVLRILAVALPVPLGYQIFRMGYYGVLTPHTAVAKSASDSAWANGWLYVLDLAQPYFLLIPFLLVIAVVTALVSRRRREGSEHEVPIPRRMALRSSTGIVVLVIGTSLLHLLYVIRVGGDFMHGRMLLLPLFTLVMPVMVIPAFEIGIRWDGARDWTTSVVAGVGALGMVAWTVVVMPMDGKPFSGGPVGVVDERSFWTAVNGQGRAPILADDYRGFLRNWDEALTESARVDAAMMINVPLDSDSDDFVWEIGPRNEKKSDLREIPGTLYMTSLGRTGMSAPLDVRVLDTIGLATPLAARQPRLPDARIGHDKDLPVTWQYADSDLDLSTVPDPELREGAMLARAALRHPEFAGLFASYRGPLTVERFFANLAYSFGNGRSLALDPDPRMYLDAQTVKEIARNARERPKSASPTVVEPHSVTIAWPQHVNLDKPR